MGGKLARSWELTKQAWSVIRDDKRLLVFPLISGTLVTLLMVASAAGVIALITQYDVVGNSDEAFQQFSDDYGPLGYVALFVLYFITYFIITFFQAAPQALVVRAGRKRVPPRLVLAGHYVAWIVVSVLVGWWLLASRA